MLFQTAIETTLAAEALKELKTGEILGYDHIRALIDKDPQDDGYSFVMSARRKIERQCECVFEAVPNVGIKKLPPREVINRGSRDLCGIRRGIRRSVERQTTLVPVEANAGLNASERQAFLANYSHLGLLQIMMRPKATRLITGAVQRANAAIEPGQTLALFARRKA